MKYQMLTEAEFETADLNACRLIVDTDDDFDCHWENNNFAVHYNGSLVSQASGEFEKDYRKGIVYHSVFVKLAETGETVEVEVTAPLFS